MRTEFRLTLSLLLAGGLELDAASITLHPLADTTIASGSIQASGQTDTLVVGETATAGHGRALLRFDLAGQVPANATVTSAELRIVVTRTPPFGAVDSRFDLHRMLVEWDELEAGWEGPDLLTDWAARGGSAGVDFADVASASVAMGGNGTYTFASTSNLIADVQHWVTNRNANFGWMIRSDGEGSAMTARRVGSRESLSGARPELVIGYSTGPARPRIELFSVSNNLFRLHFTAAANTAYVVESLDSLSASNWMTVTNIAAQANEATVVVADPIATGQRYYRVAVP